MKVTTELKCMLAAAWTAGLAFVSPLAASADDFQYNDGTHIWRGYTDLGVSGNTVAVINGVRRADGETVFGALVVPGTVKMTVTNELGYVKDGAWITTRDRKIETLEIPVESVYGFWLPEQSDPLVTSITFSEGIKFVEFIDDDALTNVTAMTFPSTVEAIWQCLEEGCDKLRSVSVPESADIACSFFGTPWAKALGDFYVWNGVLVRYQGSAAEVTVPDGIVAIGDDAFKDNVNITSVKLPDSLQEIRQKAFAGCENLASISIPEGVRSIGTSAFAWCGALKSIELPGSVREVGFSAFEGTPISTLVIPEGVTELYCTFADMTNLTSVTIPNTVKILRGGHSDGAFSRCTRLATVDIPDGVETIGDYAFSGCTSLTSVTGGAGLKSVSGKVIGYNDENRSKVPYFRDAPDGLCVLGAVAYGYKGDLPADIVIPSTVKHVMAGLLDGKDKDAVKTITLSDGVETVGDAAFADCHNLTTVNLGNTVVRLEANAFGGCEQLETVTGGAALESGLKAFDRTRFRDDQKEYAGNDGPFELIRIGHVVIGYRGKFEAGEYVVSDDVTEFGPWGEDESMGGVTALTGGAALTAFEGFSKFANLQRIDLAGALTTDDTEEYCCGLGKLTEVNLPNAMFESIDPSMFSGCANLERVVLGLAPKAIMDGDCDIDSAMFKGCDKLQAVDFRCRGYELTGFIAEILGIREPFGNELQTFKYYQVRTDFRDPKDVPLFPLGFCKSFTLVPQIVACEYAITYEGLEDAENPNPATFTSDDLPLTLVPPERAGYTFLGWTPNDGVIPVGTASNVTFTATWKQGVEPQEPVVDKDGKLTQVKIDEDGTATVPTEVGGVPVTSIARGAFDKPGITSIVIENPALVIPLDAFGVRIPVVKVVVGGVTVEPASWLGDDGKAYATIAEARAADCTTVLADVDAMQFCLYPNGGGGKFVPAVKSADTYNGTVISSNGVEGTVQVKAKKPNKRTGFFDIQAKVVTLVDKATYSFKAKGLSVPTNGVLTVELPASNSKSAGHKLVVTLDGDSLTGAFDSFLIDGARDVFAAKDTAKMAAVKPYADTCWTGVFGDGVSNDMFVAGFSVTIKSKNGKASVKVLDADGKSMSCNAVCEVGANGAVAVPVTVRKSAKTAAGSVQRTFGFRIAFSTNGVASCCTPEGDVAPCGAVDVSPVRDWVKKTDPVKAAVYSPTGFVAADELTVTPTAFKGYVTEFEPSLTNEVGTVTKASLKLAKTGFITGSVKMDVAATGKSASCKAAGVLVRETGNGVINLKRSKDQAVRFAFQSGPAK